MATGVADQINRVQFISEDFATYRSEADNFFSTNYPTDFNNLLNTELGNALMDQLAFAMQSLSFMVNRRASELFLATAKLNSSITKLARMLGYPIASASPATTDATIVFPDAPYLIPIQIPTGFQFLGPGSIIYEYANSTPAILNAGQTQITIPVKEGQTRVISFTSDGTANQVFSLFGIPSTQFLYSDAFSASVDGVLWTRLDLLKFEATNIYEVLFTGAPPQLVFGDGIAGNIPPLNSSIIVSFRYGLGLQGTIGKDQLSAPVTNLVVNGTTINMNLTNNPADSGSDPEDIRHVQSFASSFFRTQNAAVIKSDYDTIAELQPGVALADAQIMRGIAQDITIQSDFAEIEIGMALVESAVSGILATTVTGISDLGVSGTGSLFVGGVSGLGVGGIPTLGVSGTSFLGWNGSSVTGTQFLGVSGTQNLVPIGQSGLFVGGIPNLGVSGTDELGVSNFSTISQTAVSGSVLITNGVSGLESYLSQAFSDTSKANQVQVIVLGVDVNNRYISPSSTVLNNVKNTLQALADAVVTVVAVDGSSRIVNADILVQLGISQNAVQSDVETQVLQSLIQTTQPYGLCVRRKPGLSLYTSQIEDAIRAATTAGDIIYMNVKILNPTNLLDAAGNLIIGIQQVIQNGAVNVVTVERVLGT